MFYCMALSTVMLLQVPDVGAGVRVGQLHVQGGGGGAVPGQPPARHHPPRLHPAALHHGGWVIVITITIITRCSLFSLASSVRAASVGPRGVWGRGRGRGPAAGQLQPV